jgi:hypothetical protein
LVAVFPRMVCSSLSGIFSHLHCSPPHPYPEMKEFFLEVSFPSKSPPSSSFLFSAALQRVSWFACIGLLHETCAVQHQMYTVLTEKAFSQNTTIHSIMWSLLHVSVTVTIIRQTIQYMDITCSVVQYGLQCCLHLPCRISDI